MRRWYNQINQVTLSPFAFDKIYHQLEDYREYSVPDVKQAIHMLVNAWKSVTEKQLSTVGLMLTYAHDHNHA